MNIKNKNGFTLVELMAVVIILIVIVLISINLINKSIDESHRKSIVANAGTYIKAVEDFVAIQSLTNSNYKNNIFSVSQLTEAGVELSGTKPDNGTIHIVEKEVVEVCLNYGDYYIEYENGEMSKPRKGSCPNFELAYDYNYIGSEQTFVAPINATYKLEVWGAQGGEAIGRVGGYGGYSTGKIYLKKGTKLYINVGGMGESTQSTAFVPYQGGYNGGGNSRCDGATAWGAGGGATSIAFTSGLLKNVPSSSLIMVASGGGGGGTYNGSNNIGGHGGGYVGNRGDGGCGGYGGSQTAGGGGCGGSPASGSYGQGANYGDVNSGGGGGYYGGGTGYNSGSGGGGGSGYIAYQYLYDKAMYCYNCTEAARTSIKTNSVTCNEETATEECAKKGNGFARISYISSESESKYPSHLEVLYDNGTENVFFYTDCDRASETPSFQTNKIVLGTNYYSVFYTGLLDLSKYKSLIFQRTNVTPGRIYFNQYPQYANNGGEGADINSLGYTSLGNDYYVVDISSLTRKDLHFAMNQYYSDGSGEVYFIALSSKTKSEIISDHSYLP